MITEKKVVLLVRDDVGLEDVNYEGLLMVTTSEECAHAWRCNKTPVVNHRYAQEIMQKFKNSLVILPEYQIDKDVFPDFCRNEGFEPGEYRAKKKYDTSKDSCFLCDTGKYTSYLEVRTFNAHCAESELIMYTSKNFFVKIELGCLTPGMVMISPKNHILSAAQIPEDQRAEYQQVKEDVELLLTEIFGGPVIFFEHGSAPDGMSSHKRSVVHAHTHVCPNMAFEPKYLRMVALKHCDNLFDFNETKYLSYQVGANGEMLICADPEVYVQRQYPRQVIALKLGISNEKSNWRTEPFNDKMHETFMRYYEYLTSEKGKALDPRIIEATKGFIDGYRDSVFFEY